MGCAPQYDVGVIGLGPVGLVTAACLARQGLRVLGVDKDRVRVRLIQRGTLPFLEPGLGELLKFVSASGHFRVSSSLAGAESAPILMLAVGTPTPEESGAPDLSALEEAAQGIGELLRQRRVHKPVIALRSTVPPGTLEARIAPIIEAGSNLKAGKDFHLVSNPEFLREGKAIDDFFAPSRIVIGASSPEAAQTVAELYRDVKAERIFCSVRSAEFAKYADNSWHALKVAFANEIGRTVASFGGDVEEATRIFLADAKLNLSSAYLTPGFAFGGSCLPKDVRGLLHLARTRGETLPLIASILPSNEEHIRRTVEAALATHAKKVGMLGLSFKAQVDDCRESPALYAAAALRAAGIDLLAHDAAYPEGAEIRLPRKGGMLRTSTLETVAESPTLLLFHRRPEYERLAERKRREGGHVINCTSTAYKEAV